ncbi:MAG: helix-turn-helix domain-containing protein [Pseudomonadota bacterium]
MAIVRPTSREAILEAAFQLLSETPGASLGDIADRAGVGRATLHRHFAGRADLMRALAEAANSELEAATIAAIGHIRTAEDRLRLSLAAMMPLANRHAFLSGPDVDEAMAEASAKDRSWLTGEIELAKIEGVFAKDVPTFWIAEAYEGVLYAGWTMISSGEATPKQAAELAWRTLTHGLNGDAK